jgi:hypothetical protein
MSLQTEIGDILAKKGQDEEFKKSVLRDPIGTLKNAGVEIPEGVKIEVHQNSPETVHAVLPLREEGVLEAWQKISPPGAKVIERAWTDPDYKKRLFSDPRSAFAEATGITPPEGWTLFGHENTSTELHFVLPYTAETGELSDADLEQVAGGKSDQAVSDACEESTEWTEGTWIALVVAAAASIGKTA